MKLGGYFNMIHSNIRHYEERSDAATSAILKEIASLRSMI